jgi:hypothetical protein
MRKVRVHTTVEVDGKTYKPGDFADVSEEAMEFLVKNKAASAVIMMPAGGLGSNSSEWKPEKDEGFTSGAEAVAAQKERVQEVLQEKAGFLGMRKGSHKNT